MKEKIEQFRKTRRNLFSTTEAIQVALLHPDLYPELMPQKYIHDPVGAQMQLDHRQREKVWNVRLGICQL